MEPDRKQELLQLIRSRVLERLGNGSVRAADLAAEIVRDYPELWESVRDRLARERLTSAVLTSLDRMARPAADEGQLSLPLAGFERLPRVISVDRSWKRFEDLTLPELNVIVQRYEAHTRKHILARLKERGMRRKEMRRVRRMLGFFFPSDHGITVGSASQRREEFEAAIAQKVRAERMRKRAAEKAGAKKKK